MNMIKGLFTGKDNVTHDIGRWLTALTSMSGVFLQGWSVIVQHEHFSMQEFGVGVGALAAGLGAMLKLKADTEPEPKNDVAT